MSLDLTQVASQIEGMSARLRAEAQGRAQRLKLAVATLHSQAAALEVLKSKIETSKTSWLVAGLVDDINLTCKASLIPSEFSVLAADGSQIDVDRHHSVRCYLVNIGSVYLHYGNHPDAMLVSSPVLYSREGELVITPSKAGGRQETIEGPLLGIKRSVDECHQLAMMAAEFDETNPVLALLDGSLILWGLAGDAYPEFVIDAMLKNGLLKYLDEIRAMTDHRKLALASYISFPRSTDVVNVLRVALCPHDPVNCDRYCSGKDSSETKECDSVAGLRDAELFDLLLDPGERSAVFISRSSVVQKHYGIHRVNFFYLKVDDEIARVEVPSWVAADEGLLGLVHTLVIDQCRRGQGYPVALSEAHEKAVVTAADREQFWKLVEQALSMDGLPQTTSAKSNSKRGRWV